MKEVRKYHRKAMEIAEKAFKLKKDGYHLKAIRLFEEAYNYEKKAAKLVPLDDKNEPSRSILFRSAASLALNAKMFRETELMIANGLLGKPPEEIADELRDLFDQNNFERHLKLKDVKLSDNEFIFSLVGGSEVGHGYVRSEEFIKRIEIINDITLREVERIYQSNEKRKLVDNKIKNFEDYKKARLSKKVVQMYKPYLQTPMAGSFRVIIQIGESQDKSLFPNHDNVVEDLINHIIDSVEFVNNSSIDKLRDKYSIDEENYFDHLLTSIKNLAPDGNRVKMVGFTRNDEEKKEKVRKVKLVKIHKDIKLESFNPRKEDLEQQQREELEGKKVKVVGILDFAKSKKNIISITDNEGNEHMISVSIGKMSAIVKANYEDEVKILGIRRFKGKKETIELIDIERID